MSESVKQDKEGNLRLKVAGKCVVQFVGADLPRVESVLTTAAGVVPRRGDVRADIKAWKFVCGWNAGQVMRAAKALRERVEDILHYESGAHWKAYKARIEAALADCGMELPAGVPLVDLAVCGEWGEVAAMLDRETSTKMAARFDQLLQEVALSENACATRRQAIEHASEAMQKPVDVTVAQVAWDKVPGALSGGYMRELIWMFAGVPPDVAQLQSGARGC